MTERLYYTDSSLADFEASVLKVDESRTRVVLDRTAFYPDSGGQPRDHGQINGVEVVDLVEEEGELIHVLGAALPAVEAVQGRVDRARRFDHMQQHSGQHLLSAVFDALFGYATLSFHMGAEASTIELSASALDSGQCQAAERRANEIVFENRPLSVAFEEAAEVEGLRKESKREGLLRIVSIEGIDRSACGGTHVRHTGEIGPILLRKLEKIRGNVRVEFLCGHRAVRRARLDYDALSQIARLFSSPLDDTAALVAAQLEDAREAEKSRRKLALEMAACRGRELYAQTSEGPDGRRRYLDQRASGPLDDETRAVGQSFCAQSNGLYVATSAQPATILVVASADAGIHAGNLLKQALAAAGGRGGGNAQVAQGSLPSAEAVAALLPQLGF
ncbi:alanyl-tRNA editing protein [Paludibaculum fermentans]|uniref:Alanyl-tRNA editing protein n=1 Tax=Paludibaculum fermentans TaxID=1473598 RepID=A0A7S7NNU6_PALFE|nr:alanyl-tRNA editing protein [Paludibaculum fermentans]QOY87035.1 alanyl-tRNA editing protein [Paludibaculum fermentans]